MGRGSRTGQILLLTDDQVQVAERTLQRLRTLQAFDRLGAGFAISARDLDMRGAGDLIGDAQAGDITLIGVSLYQHLLEAALRQARGEQVDRWSPELKLSAAGSLPVEWIPEPELRISLYARLARAETGTVIDALQEELVDRFGPLPLAAETLMTTIRIRALAKSAGIAQVDAGPGAIALTPRHGFSGGAATFGLEEKNGRLILSERIDDEAARLERTRMLLEDVAEVSGGEDDS